MNNVEAADSAVEALLAAVMEKIAATIKSADFSPKQDHPSSDAAPPASNERQ